MNVLSALLRKYFLHFRCIDHFISKEIFELYKCAVMRFDIYSGLS